MNSKESIPRLPWYALLTLLVALGGTRPVQAQMTLQIKDMAHSKAILVENYGARMFVIDTLVSNAKGIFRSGTLPLQSGRLYSLILPDWHYANLDFFYNGQPLRMKTTSADPIGSMQIKKSPDNQALYTDAALALPLLTALNDIVLEDATGRADEVQSLIDQLRKLRAEHLERFAGTSWARIYQLDDNGALPWHNIREYGNLMRGRDAGGEAGLFASRFREGDRRQALDPLFENRLRHLLRRHIELPDSTVPVFEDLLDRSAGDLLILHKFFEIFQDELVAPRHLGFEDFLIDAWDRHFIKLKKDDETDKTLRTAGEFTRLLRDNRNGSLIGEIDVRNAKFEKTSMADIIDGNRFTILVFYDLKNTGHMRAILDWRDSFNRSGLYNQQVKLVFISIYQEESKWVDALHNLNILDHVNYLDWLGNQSTDQYYHPLVAAETPISYLVGQQGRIVSKFSLDITDYFLFMINE